MANIVVVSGRMVADPELRNISEDKAVCNFRIAVPKRFKPQEGADSDFSMRSHGIIQRNLSANIFPRESGSNLSVHSKLGTGKIVKEIGGLQRRLPCPASISLEIRKIRIERSCSPKQ